MLNISCIFVVSMSPGACHHFGEKGRASEQLLENPPMVLMAITPSAHLLSRSQADAKMKPQAVFSLFFVLSRKTVGGRVTGPGLLWLGNLLSWWDINSVPAFTA